jgi:hypothetical protein
MNVTYAVLNPGTCRRCEKGILFLEYVDVHARLAQFIGLKLIRLFGDSLLLQLTPPPLLPPAPLLPLLLVLPPIA